MTVKLDDTAQTPEHLLHKLALKYQFYHSVPSVIEGRFDQAIRHGQIYISGSYMG